MNKPPKFATLCVSAFLVMSLGLSAASFAQEPLARAAQIALEGEVGQLIVARAIKNPEIAEGLARFLGLSEDRLAKGPAFLRAALLEKLQGSQDPELHAEAARLLQIAVASKVDGSLKYDEKITAEDVEQGEVRSAILGSLAPEGAPEWKNSYDCTNRMAGEAGQSLLIQHRADGTLRARATQSWIGGKHDSGWVDVTSDSSSGFLKFVNRDAGFSAEIGPSVTMNSGGVIARLIRGVFKDPNTGMSGQLRPGSCR